MKTEPLRRPSAREDQQAILTLVRTMLGGTQGREDPEHPLPPGPWDPVVRAALERVDILSLRREAFGAEVALNPQPLPPRFAFLLAAAQTIVDRAELLQELADAARDGQQGSASSGYVARFADDFCGTGFRLRFPFPGPRPRWFADELSGTDLIVLATHFGAAAKTAFSPALGRSFAAASARLAEAGLSRTL